MGTKLDRTPRLSHTFTYKIAAASGGCQSNCRNLRVRKLQRTRIVFGKVAADDRLRSFDRSEPAGSSSLAKLAILAHRKPRQNAMQETFWCKLARINLLLRNCKAYSSSGSTFLHHLLGSPPFGQIVGDLVVHFPRDLVHQHAQGTGDGEDCGYQGKR